MKNNQRNLSNLIKAIKKFHDKNNFKENGGHEPLYRLTLMAEELGEIAQCITKGKPKEELGEEIADLLILLLGNEIAFGIDIEKAFWKKMDKIMKRQGKIINGRIRVSESFN